MFEAKSGDRRYSNYKMRTQSSNVNLFNVPKDKGWKVRADARLVDRGDIQAPDVI